MLGETGTAVCCRMGRTHGGSTARAFVCKCKNWGGSIACCDENYCNLLCVLESRGMIDLNLESFHTGATLEITKAFAVLAM